MQVTGHAGGTAPRTTYDAVERALATCLAALADLAGSAGQADRVARLLAAAQALSATVPPPRPPTAGGPMPLDRVADGDQLTAREHEVARFIARGLTNRQIGEELIISERTADTHVQNILGKLHLVSRAQVAAWVIERRPSLVILPAGRVPAQIGRKPPRLSAPRPGPGTAGPRRYASGYVLSRMRSAEGGARVEPSARAGHVAESAPGKWAIRVMKT